MGTGIVEYLLVLPVLFYFLTAIVDLGIMGADYAILDHAAYVAIEEVKFSGYYNSTAQQLLAQTLQPAPGYGIDPSQVQVSAPDAVQPPGTAVVVVLSYDYKPPIPVPGFSAPVGLTAGATGFVFQGVS